MRIKVNDDIEKIMFKLGLEKSTAIRLITIRSKIVEKYNRHLELNELLDFLYSAMNYDEMQIWLMKNNTFDRKSLNDKLKKLFELETDENILSLYEIEKDSDSNNIETIKKALKK